MGATKEKILIENACTNWRVSKAHVARFLGVTPNTLLKWCSGKCRMPLITFTCLEAIVHVYPIREPEDLKEALRKAWAATKPGTGIGRTSDEIVKRRRQLMTDILNDMYDVKVRKLDGIFIVTEKGKGEYSFANVGEWYESGNYPPEISAWLDGFPETVRDENR